MAFIFTADCHLCIRNVKSHRGMTHDSIISFDQIIDLCLKHHADLVIGGDLFDRARPESEVILRFQAAIDILYETGLTTYFIQGQHERSIPAWANIGHGTVHLDRNVYTVHAGEREYNITGLDWRPSEEFNAIITDEDWPQAAIFVGHQVWREFNYGVAEADLGRLHNHHQLILVGDYHKTHHVGMPGCDAYSTGSISMMSIDEPEGKQVLLFDDSLTPRVLPLKTRPVSRFVLRDGGDLDQLLASSIECYDPFDKSILDVVYDASIPNVLHHVRDAFAKTTHLWMRPIKNEIVEASADNSLPVGSAEDGVITAIQTLLTGKERDIATRLWESAQVADEIEEVTEEELAR